MIEVKGLTKRYPGRTAVNGISFTVTRGEVVGFLGPNGAGKSTTMRILASYLPGTSGTARVAGFDVFHQPDEVRRRIGYMPENNPLHLDMRVREYLKFRARLKGLGWRRSRGRVDTVLEQCGLAEVQQRIIGQLSKGYRQRVGLADALVHEPDLIILDEPTIGLDPHQIRAVRALIKDLAQRHTVLLSTHILSEVEVTCSRVLILNRGEIIAADTAANLERRLSLDGGVVAEVAVPAAVLQDAVRDLPDVLHAAVEPMDGPYQRLTLSPRAGVDLRPMVYELVRANDWPLRELTRRHHSLEEIFVHLTRSRKEAE
ncbi:MAG: ATP-binding cassette domain-containing protein [Verrucomicrobiae bacterium]|nr:ATP-binding cassette domain-containing protein [Verrucomicrobiae bacterium]